MIDEAASRSPRDETTPSGRASIGMTTLGTAAGFGAVLAAASCCVLPLALAGFGLGAGLSSTFDALMPLRWPLAIVSVLGLAGGWWAYGKRRKACAMDAPCVTSLPSPATPIMLSIGTLLTLAAILWDRFESSLMGLLT